MNEKEFILKYTTDKPIFELWGKYVKRQITDALCLKYTSPDEILKIPVKPRVKAIDSIIAKAFYRGKEYKDPYNEITDKVGMRFVVLTVDQILAIKDIVETDETWTFSEDVDYVKNMLEKPELFTYQSVHYIVKNMADLFLKDNIKDIEVKIPKGTPCEIQIRTLLQHAYAELSHDTIYKKDDEIPSEVKRIMARSMALIETTDSLFKEVNDLLSQEDKLYKEYEKYVFKYTSFNEMTEKLNKYIYSSYKDVIKINTNFINSLDDFMQEKTFLFDKITEKQDISILYRQPIVFLLYYLIKNNTNEMLEKWPLDENLLNPLFTDLGISFD